MGRECMRRHRVAVLFALAALVGPAVVAPAAGASPRQNARCVAEAARLGLLDKQLNPSNHTFVGGTLGGDGQPFGSTPLNVAANEVWCGFGGDDLVTTNDGIVIGGDGTDSVSVNNGTFYGGPGNDDVFFNAATGRFYGQGGNDSVFLNRGFFNGGPGFDSIEESSGGTCQAVEVMYQGGLPCGP
jgi:hypothetical protein